MHSTHDDGVGIPCEHSVITAQKSSSLIGISGAGGVYFA